MREVSDVGLVVEEKQKKEKRKPDLFYCLGEISATIPSSSYPAFVCYLI